MKIGFFTDSFRPYTSGVVRSIETFTKELTELGHSVYIFAPQYKGVKKEQGVFRYVSVPSPTNKGFSLAIPISVNARSLIKKLGLDIIHVHSPFLMGRLGAKLALLENIPLIYTYHTLYDKYLHYIPFAPDLSGKLIQRLTAHFCNRCDLVVVPTKVVGEIIRYNGVNASIRDIPTGINLEGYETGNNCWLRDTYNIPPDQQILLFVGRIGQEKNLIFLMESFLEILQVEPLLKMVLVGGGPFEQELKQAIKSLGLTKSVIFTGTLNREEVINCYLGADLFVFASTTETQGLVLGEAKAAGLPVVAVNAYGTSEMVTNNQSGFLTDLNKKEFAQQVLTLLEDKELYLRMSSQAKKEANLISSRSCALELVRAYQDVISLKRQDVAGY
ncbi:MAG: glycosyltransferase family 4 protein [Bacillota bacterium]